MEKKYLFRTMGTVSKLQLRKGRKVFFYSLKADKELIFNYQCIGHYL